MINYVAHWDRILIQSRSKIVNELNNYEFRSICPIVDENAASLGIKSGLKVVMNKCPKKILES